MRIRSHTTFALATAIAALSVHADAGAVTYQFSDSLTASFADVAVANLTINNVAGGTLWTLSANYDSTKYSSAFLFGVNYAYRPTGTSVSAKSFKASDFTTLSGAIGVKSSGVSSINFSTANNAQRFTSGESIQWLVKNTVDSQFSDFVLHVNAINGTQSVKFGAVAVSPVPEPSTGALLLVGLGVAGWVASRRGRAGAATTPQAQPA